MNRPKFLSRQKTRLLAALLLPLLATAAAASPAEDAGKNVILSDSVAEEASPSSGEEVGTVQSEVDQSSSLEDQDAAEAARIHVVMPSETIR